MIARTLLFSTLSFIMALPLVAREPADAPQAYRDAYFAETHDGDFAAAIKNYEKVVAAKGVSADIVADAKARLASCKEALRCGDLASLMPKDAIVFAQVSQPGTHLAGLLDNLGLVGDPLKNIGADAITASDWDGAVLPKNVCISRLVTQEISRFGAVAVAVTDFDAKQEKPSGVLIINPGKADLLRGWLETVAQFGPATDPIGGHPTLHIPEEDFPVTITFTARLVIAGTSRDLVSGVVERLNGGGGESLLDAPAFASQAATRDNAMLYAFVNGKQALKQAYKIAQHEQGMMQDLGMAQAFFDLQHLESISLAAGMLDDGARAEFVMTMSEGQTNMIYNLLRTPPIRGEALSKVPATAAAVLSFGLNPESNESGNRDVATKVQTVQTITGLDLAREIFANIREVAIFVDTPDEKRTGPPIPDAGLVMTVGDADKSEALWGFLLSLPARFMGDKLDAPTASEVHGVAVQTYHLPEGVQVMLARHKDAVVVAMTPAAMKAALATIDSGKNIMSDPQMKAAIDTVKADTSVALIAHVGRIMRMGASMEDGDEAPMIRRMSAAMDATLVTALIEESETRCGINWRISGLPKARTVIELLQESGAFGAAPKKEPELLAAPAEPTALAQSNSSE